MRLVSFSTGAGARLGILVDGAVVDLREAYAQLGAPLASSRGIREIPPDMVAFLNLGEAGMNAARLVERAARDRDSRLNNPQICFDEGSVKLLAPVPVPTKIVCIGLNYRDHCEENNKPIPERPIIFAKFSTAVIGPGDAIVRPRLTRQLDYEAELGVVIGRAGKHISIKDAPDYIAGYTIMHDVSARDIQFGDGQWVRGKTFDTFCPMGPALVTPDEVGDPHNLAIRAVLNGRVMQDSNTGNMIFNCYYLVSYLSQVFTLQPGDCILTGTPGGVGAFRQPPVWLEPGDTITIEIEKLGSLTNTVVDEA
jgi:2-keto-4-pentenoate hydratase/2-oxohepta-3-ene-1,7-dioic acid hydratase in catechol pathway